MILLPMEGLKEAVRGITGLYVSPRSSEGLGSSCLVVAVCVDDDFQGLDWG